MAGAPTRSAIVVSLGALAGSYLAVRTDKAGPIDRAAERLRVPLGALPDRIMAAATDLGSVFAVGGTATVLFASGRRQAAVDVTGAGATAWILGQAAKPLLDRSRPYEEDPEQAVVDRLVAVPHGSSWPSGHSAVVGAVGTVVADHAHAGPLGRAAGFTLAGFVGASRVYVGVHHATDVIGGWAVGVLSAGLWRGARRTVQRLWQRRRSR